MANHNVFLKFDGTSLLWSPKQDGAYTELKPETITCTVNGKDTVTFTAVSGIQKIVRIDDGMNGSPKMIKSKRGEDSGTVVVTINNTTVKGEIDKYDITFLPSGNVKSAITVDPEIQGGGEP